MSISNRDRSYGMDPIIQAYRRRVFGTPSAPLGEVLEMLVADLRHWACANDVAFSDAMNGAAELFWAEIRGEAMGRDTELQSKEPIIYGKATQDTPELRRLMTLTRDEWARANEIIYSDTPERVVPPLGPGVEDPMEPPASGVIDLTHRADRVDDMVISYAMINGIMGEGEDVQLTDFLDDLWHFATHSGVDLELVAIAPSARIFADDCMGRTPAGGARLALHDPELAQRVAEVGAAGPGESGPDLASADWLRINDLVYWGIERELADDARGPGTSLEDELFGPSH